MLKKSEYSISDFALGTLALVVFFYLLHIGGELILPFIIALLFSFALLGLQNFYNKFTPTKPSSFPWDTLSFVLSLGTYLFLFWLIGKMLGSNIDDFLELVPDYQEKIMAIIHISLEYFGIENTKIDAIISGFNINDLNLQGLIGGIFEGITTIFSNAGLILFYVLFILLEYRYFGEKLNLMIKDDTQRKHVTDIIVKIKNDIKSYFAIKTIVSLITATLSLVIMLSFGVDFAVFWAFLIFILNFIPSVGSVIAVSFPILLSLIQFDSYYPFIFITTGLVGVQILMGNIIEPKIVGNKLNLSPLVIILALAFWYQIWGITGMLLSVPIMVIINIILGKIPATRSLAILLSEKGELEVEAQEEVIKTRKRLIRKVKEKFTK